MLSFPFHTQTFLQVVFHLALNGLQNSFLAIFYRMILYQNICQILSMLNIVLDVLHQKNIFCFHFDMKSAKYVKLRYKSPTDEKIFASVDMGQGI